MAIVKGYNYQIEYGSAALSGTPTYSELSDRVEEVSPPKPEIDEVDVTHMQSPDQWKEYLAIWKDQGEFSATMQFQKETYTLLEDVLFGEVRAYRFTDNDGNKLVTDAFLKSFGQVVDRAGIVKIEATWKASGPPDFTAAA